jgi:hypothetical protein
LSAADLRGEPAVKRAILGVTGHVRHPGGETVEDLVVESLARAQNSFPRQLHELLGGDLSAGHPHDRAAEQSAALQPVQRAEGHLPGEIAGDAEDHQQVRGAAAVLGHPKASFPCALDVGLGAPRLWNSADPPAAAAHAGGESRLPHPLDGQRSLARAGLGRGLEGVEGLQRLAGGLEIGVWAAGSADAVPVKLAAHRAEHAGDGEADVPPVKLLDDLDEDGPGGVIDVADGRAVQDQPLQRASLAGERPDVVG